LTNDAAKLIQEMSLWFPVAHLMDALGIIYPQYWLEEGCDSKFEKHLRFVKAEYGHSVPFSTAILPNGSLDPILSPAKLDLQMTLFMQCMKENAARMMKKPFKINPVTWLWRSIDANSFLKHQLSKYITVAEIAIVMVLGSVQDVRMFSTVSFLKTKLRNWLTKNLAMTVAFKQQQFFTIEDFPYDSAYDSWKDETKRMCDSGI
jgi:hypothetical protein